LSIRGRTFSSYAVANAAIRLKEVAYESSMRAGLQFPNMLELYSERNGQITEPFQVLQMGDT